MIENDLLVIVLGYGYHLTDPIKRYLEFVTSFIRQQRSGTTTIITTGGYTNRKSAPGVSEAGMMAGYLKECGVTAQIIVEESSVTTIENLRNVKSIAHELGFTGKQIVVFCDSARSFKVRIIGRLIISCWLKINTYKLTKGVVANLKQLIIATPLDILASQFSFFEKMALRRKEDIMNNS